MSISSSVVTTPVALFVAVTETPGKTAPLKSVTVPLAIALIDCHPSLRIEQWVFWMEKAMLPD